MRLKFISIIVLFVLAISAESHAQFSIDFNSTYSYLKGKDAGSLPTNWMNPDFDDSGWSQGNSPFRYGDGLDGTNLTDMQNNYSTLYLRKRITIDDTAGIQNILIKIDYDDGFILWINGIEAIHENAPANPTSTSFAIENHESGSGVSYTIPANALHLKPGDNTVAVQVFNVSRSSSDLYFELWASGLRALSESDFVTFSKEAGFYNQPFDLLLTASNSGLNIVYTIDGSNPINSQTSKSATGTVTIHIDADQMDKPDKTPAVIIRASVSKVGFNPAFPLSKTYIFTEKVKTQSYPGGNWAQGTVNDQVLDYEMDPEIINDNRYKNQITDALLSIPTIAISTSYDNLFNSETGIYVNAEGHGDGWERECTVELINPDNTESFQINAGLRIRGGWSRHGYNPKHAFRLFFRNSYGAGKLLFPLFGDEGTDEFDKIDLRTSQNYSWSLDGWDVSHNTFVRDEYCRDLQREMNQPYTRSRYYHLYLNGMYWGLFETQERSESRFASSYFGGDPDDYDVVKVNTENYSYTIEATDGTLDSWKTIYNLTSKGFASNTSYFNLEGKDANGLPKKEGKVLVDIDNLIDYMLDIFFTGNFDSPTSSFGQNKGANNFFAIYNHERNDKGYQFFVHDAEHAMMVVPITVGTGIDEDRVNLADRTDGNKMEVYDFSSFHPQWLHHKLCANAEYRQRFSDRAYQYFYNKGLFTTARIQEMIESRAGQIETAIIAESARWGDAQHQRPYNKDNDWQPEIDELLYTWAVERPDYVIDQLIEANLLSNIEPPRFSQNGISLTDEKYLVQNKLYIDIKSPLASGTIFYTIDGNDPRNIGGAIYEKAIESNKDLTLSISSSTIIKARLKAGSLWSSLRTVSFYSQNDDYSKFKVTELHYHPLDYVVGTDTTDGKDLEFIEFKNIGSTALNLSGFKLSSSVNYQFPDNTLLPPGAFYVIATKPSKFYKYYGMVASGNCSGNFSNGGEFILLTDSVRKSIFSFEYDDSSPWPAEPDGMGYSLVSERFNPTGNPDTPDYWRTSRTIGGSPFHDDEWPVSQPETPMAQTITNRYDVFPNPSGGNIYLQFNDWIENEKVNVRITDLQGKEIYQTKTDKEMVLRLNEFSIPAGLYLIQFEDSRGITCKKIIYQPK